MFNSDKLSVILLFILSLQKMTINLASYALDAHLFYQCAELFGVSYIYLGLLF